MALNRHVIIESYGWCRLLGVLLCCVVFMLQACTRRTAIREEAIIFGTTVGIQVEGVSADKARQAIQAVFADDQHLHALLHPWETSGALMQLNQHVAQGEEMIITPELCHILYDVRRLSRLTGDYFNPAIGQEVATWGFYTDQIRPHAVDEVRLQTIVAHHPTMQALHIAGWPGGRCRVWSENRFVRIDLSGYAKGLALDRGRAILMAHGIRHALINAGGNIIVLGGHVDGQPWRVGLRDPRSRAVFAVLPLLDGEAVGTSGDYYHYFMWHGQRYAHLLDPRTGYPAQGMMSVTVLVRPQDARWSGVGVLSDVLSKPFFVAGPQYFTEEQHRLGCSYVLAFDAEHHLLMSTDMMRRLHRLPVDVPLSYPDQLH